MNNRGITLVELVVIVSVIGILAMALGFTFSGWISGYKVESQTKELYIDMMNSRAKAMNTNKMHFFVLTSNQYTVYEDSDPAPDGNQTLDTSNDTLVLQETLATANPLTWNGAAQVNFSKRGLANVGKTLCIFSDADPDYDCLVVSDTRINMGKITNPGGSCSDANICNTK
jgi:Tfp pilus assembly protein FimT